MERKNYQFSNSIVFWAAVILAFFVLVIFGYFILREKGKKDQVEKEIMNLREQAEKIKKENNFLEEKIAYLDSDQYREVQAKEKLNLQNPGENLIVVSDGPIKKEIRPEDSYVLEEKTPEPQIPNYKKWLDYFFK